jgi:hypothetical protein
MGRLMGRQVVVRQVVAIGIRYLCARHVVTSAAQVRDSALGIQGLAAKLRVNQCVKAMHCENGILLASESVAPLFCASERH